MVGTIVLMLVILLVKGACTGGHSSSFIQGPVCIAVILTAEAWLRNLDFIATLASIIMLILVMLTVKGACTGKHSSSFMQGDSIQCTAVRLARNTSGMLQILCYKTS